MKLRGTDFGNVFNSSGARGFFGEGYWWHPYWRSFGLDWTGSTFVAKTVTYKPRVGNMPLCDDQITPRDRHPKCIYVTPRSWLHGAAVNAVGLSNAGAEYLLGLKRWQKRTEPFFLSFMAVGETEAERLDETKRFVELLGKILIQFRAPVGLKFNRSCPNTGHNLGELAGETEEMIKIARKLYIPVTVKISSEENVNLARELEDMGADAIFVSNTWRLNSIPAEVRQKVFGRTDSPLEHLGGGGVSGSPILEPSVRWVEDARKDKVEIPIVAGGGILSKRDAMRYIDAGASGISLGSIAFLRPWRVASIITRANFRYIEQTINRKRNEEVTSV